MDVAQTQEARACRCGCGTPLKSAYSEFAPGHNVRVAPRTGPRGAAAAIRELALCACGCGQRVKTPGGRYLRGHQPRTPRVGSELRTCVCGNVVRVPPSRVDTWRACSEPCLTAGNITRRTRNRLQRRCTEYLSEHRLTLKGFAEAARVTPNTFSEWLRRKGRRPSQSMVTALAVFFGIPEEQALKEAGGVTAEQRRSEIARRNIEAGLLDAGKSPETRREAGAGNRGKTKSPEHRAALSAAHKGSAAAKRASEGLAAWHRTTDGKMVQWLLSLLGNHPHPTKDQLLDYADRAAANLGTRRDLILRAWRPHLQKRGLAPKGGRRPLTERKRIVDQLRATWPRKRDGDLADGFWREATEQVNQAEGGDLDPYAVRSWWNQQT